MCGILGHTNPAIVSLQVSRQALHTLAHRGPDQWNDWADEDVYLGHRRLSIMDLSEQGRQPMFDRDQKLAITVNGEIYNYPELKKLLAAKYSFISGSDSEVLIHGYKEWGIDELLARIEGMYAFSLYDKTRKKLFLVRDRVGIKPLYYSRLNGMIAWASELKALTKLYKENKPAIDYTAVYDYLTYLYIPTPKTLYKNIFKLEPGHYLEIDLKSHEVQKKCYWRLEVKQQNVTLEAAAKKVRELVSRAVKDQLMSDVPVGFFLSGGMDSSTVVATATKFTPHINTYSIGFDIKEHDETYYAELVSKQYETNHLRKEISVHDVKKQFPKIKEWYDEPFADTSAFPTHLVSKYAKASSTVVLTGDGGDEVFGGYNWYTQFKEGVTGYVADHPLAKGLFRKTSSANKKIDQELEYYATLLGGLTKAQKDRYRKKFNIPRNYDDYWYFKKFYKPELPLLTRLQYLDFHTYLHDDILTKVDRASMAVALECRVPLLDRELVEYLFTVPEAVRYHNGELKGLMKYAFREMLPSEIIQRGKKGFSIPIGRWKLDLMGRKSTMPEYILEELYKELESR